MIISQKTIEKLRNLINEETEYRSGPKLVEFFNKYGFNESYPYGKGGFPSRWEYTDIKLKAINGSPYLDKCIKDLFAPVNFIERFEALDKFISDFNQYLAFDGSLTTFLEARIDEIKKCLSTKASLSVIFLAGSTLEGLLLGIASKNPAAYNQAKSAPKDKDTGKTKSFNDWTLNNFIDASCEIGYLREDVKKFSHALRDFRNYIHPYQQMSIGFHPDENTAKICFQVLKAAISQIKQRK